MKSIWSFLLVVAVCTKASLFTEGSTIIPTQTTEIGAYLKDSTSWESTVFTDDKTSGYNETNIKDDEMSTDSTFLDLAKNISGLKMVTEVAAEVGLEIKFPSVISENQTTESEERSVFNYTSLRTGNESEVNMLNIDSNSTSYDNNESTVLKLIKNDTSEPMQLARDDDGPKTLKEDFSFTKIFENSTITQTNTVTYNDMTINEQSASTTLRPPISSNDDIKGRKMNRTSEKSTKHVVVLLQRDCSETSMFSVLTNQIVELFSAEDKGNNKNSYICNSFLSLKFPIENITITTINSNNILPKNISLDAGYKIVRVLLTNDNDFDSGDLRNIVYYDHNKENEILKQNEIIAYTIAALSAGLLFLILIVFCCIRCFSQRQTNSLDLCDIPHLNLKLEDYKLTPIPRPSISFPDYGRELLNSTYSRSRATDTILSQHHFSGGSLSNTLKRETSVGPQELRTFNGKKSCGRVPSLDVRPQNRNYEVESWVSSSREKLNSDFERKTIAGIDNEGFKRWY